MDKNTNFFGTNPYKDNFLKKVDTHDLQKIAYDYQAKPFYQQFKPLRQFFTSFSWVIQAVTIIVSYVALNAILLPLMPTLPIVTAVLSTAILIGIEVIKRLTIIPSVQHYLQTKRLSWFSSSLTLCMVGASLWLTINGSHLTVFQMASKPQLLNIDSLTNQDRNRIEQLQMQLKEIKRTQSWKGVLTPQGAKNYTTVTNQMSEIDNRISKKESETSTKNDDLTTTHLTETSSRAIQFQWITAILDLLLIVLLAWIEYYRFRSLAEITIQNDKNDIRLPPSNDLYENRKTKIVMNTANAESTANLIKTVDNTCENCGTTYKSNHKKQRFCSSNCRVKHWEQVNGKKIHKVNSKI